MMSNAAQIGVYAMLLETGMMQNGELTEYVAMLLNGIIWINRGDEFLELSVCIKKVNGRMAYGLCDSLIIMGWRAVSFN